MTQIRAATAADREAILALRERCFGEVDPEKRDVAFWDWEFANAQMTVADDGDRLASHLALVPVGIANGQRLRGALAVDAMTAPEARGRGLFTKVVGAAMEGADVDVAIAYQNRPAVLGAMLRNGWRIEQSVPIFIRPAVLPRWPRRAANVRVLTRDDAPRMAALEMPGAHIARTREFIEWRYFDNPHWRYRVTAVEHNGALAAWLVTRRTTLKGYDTLALVDAAWNVRAAMPALLHDAVGEAKRGGCTLVAALASWRHPLVPLLAVRGFVPGPHRFRLLVHPARGGETKLPWRVLWADTDHL